MEITEEQRKRAEANRLAALEKRKRALEASGAAGGGRRQEDIWRLFKCKKITDQSDRPPLQRQEKNRPKSPPPPPPGYRVVLEICSPDEFSISPEPVKDFCYPGHEECLQRVEACLSLVPFHSVESQVGRKTVYNLQDYETVSNFLKKLDGLHLQEIPYKTRKVVENFSASVGHRWIPCLPHHLSDDEVNQLIGKLPRMLKEGLLPFQLEGVRFGLQRGGRCLIADEMGLGKTLQAVAIASCFMDEGPILVVCPAVLRYTWAEELEHWLPFCSPTDIHLVFGHHNNLDHLERSPKFVVTSYNMLHRLRKSMLKRHWALMIVDESHNLRCTKKKSESGETETVLSMATGINRIILLSGTPSLSRPFDIFHQIDLLWPKLLGNDKYEFAKNYCSPQLVKGVQGKIYKDFSKGIRLEELNVLLSQTLMIRRFKETVLLQLPQKRRQIIKVNLKGPDILLATSTCNKKTISAAAECNEESVNHCSLHESFAEKEKSVGETSDKNGCLRTSKELSHQELGIAKLSGFFEWLSNHNIATDSGVASSLDTGLPSQKMIIFAHHIKVLDGIQEYVCEKGIQFVRIDGSTSAKDRQTAVEAFRSSPEVKIVLIGITAGGVGLNFSSAQNVVFVELPKSASELLQAEDRAHRRGQTNAVNIYIFCAKNTSDESHWLQLNKSLHRVSAMMNGKVNAVKEIEVDGVYYLGNAGVSLLCTNLEGIAADRKNIEPPVNLKIEMNGGDDGHAAGDGENEVNKSLLLKIGERSSSFGKVDCNYSEEIEFRSSENVSPCKLIDDEAIPGFDSANQIEHSENISVIDDKVQTAARILIEGDEINDFQPESLRFEVSQHTGRIHLYVCTFGTYSRLRPLFENFRPEDVESMALSMKERNKETTSLAVKENPAYWDVFRIFIKEWNDLRPVERNKLLGKPLQLPLNLELCYLQETKNHGCGGLLKGGSKRRVTPLSDINFNLPPNAVWKKIILHKGSAKENFYAQAWTMTDEPLCKLCQKPCNHNLAKKPEYFEDLFCDLSCFQEYRIRTSQRSLRGALFEIECGVCTQCQLDCHTLVKCIRPLSVERRRKYIETVAPQLAEKDKLFEKLVSEPTEGNAWHADHIVPVYKGGGECRLENMRTLCVACHSKVTAAQRAERRGILVRAKKQLKLVMKELKSNNMNKGTAQPQGEENIKEDELFLQVPGSAYCQKES